MIYIITAPDKQITALTEQLKTKNHSVVTFDNLFEFKRRIGKDKPQLVLVADNLKEKNTIDLLVAISGIEDMLSVPIIGLVTVDDPQTVITFLQNGAVDAVQTPFLAAEIIARINLRVHEAQLKQRFTSSQFFWNEAQEKEQVKRTGVFRFYDSQNTEVGIISIKDGRMVFATYGSLIKEDAFLQLACNETLKFVFTDMAEVPLSNINAGITNLLMEAAKLKDEIKKQEGEVPEEVKVLVIDENRIARIMVTRTLKNVGYVYKVTSPEEMTVRFMADFAPHMLILDYQNAPRMLDMLWPANRGEKDIPVIIYCDEDIKDLNFDKIGNHNITAAVYKSKFHEELKSLLQKAKLVAVG
jgi:DNA-binding response OmpR family regulator